MIILDNYSKIGTYILINNKGYKIVAEKQVEDVWQGVGGFETGELFGVFVDNGKLYFIHNDQIFEATPDNLTFTNEWDDNKNQRFQAKIDGKVVCDFLYESLFNPINLLMGGDDEEFDFLLHLSRWLSSKQSILNFMEGMRKLKTGEYK